MLQEGLAPPPSIPDSLQLDTSCVRMIFLQMIISPNTDRAEEKYDFLTSLV